MPFASAIGRSSSMTHTGIVEGVHTDLARLACIHALAGGWTISRTFALGSRDQNQGVEHLPPKVGPKASVFTSN